MESGQKRVLEFHRAFGQLAPEKLTPLRDPQVLELRCKLLLEEVLEFCAAAGVRVYMSSPDHCSRIHDMDDLELVHNSIMVNDDKIDDIGMADALGDIKYVADGAAVCMGLDLELVEKEIHRSNMSKLQADGTPLKREDGKVLKSNLYSPPNIEGVLRFLCEK
jgi:predicted HAD superfamily Cof-like phosphohydrolase